ncbi:MAG: TIGR00341 family protein [Syntrophobacteraceae bacterium]
MELIRPQHVSLERRHKIYSEIALGSEPRLSFYMMVILSTVIAAFGLLSNSTAVVIGAMLVAPLMTPILGITLSLTSGDKSLLGHATVAEMLGIALSVGLGFIVGTTIPDVELGSEILARTTPTVFDIIVAIAAGLAGAYSMVDERLDAALPGVAIATSLVPPLAACGLCLSQARYDLAGSAFLLFFANFLSIQIVGGLIFAIFGVSGASPHPIFGIHEGNGLTTRLFFKRFALSLVLLVLIAGFMTRTLYSMISERRFHRQLESALNEELRTRMGADLVELRYSSEEGNSRVIAVVRTPQEFLPADVKDMEERLNGMGSSRIKLVVRSILSRDTDAEGPAFITEKEKLRRRTESSQARMLGDINQVIGEQLESVPGANLANLHRANGGKTIVAAVRTPTAVKPEQVKRIQDTLRKQIDPDLRLVVSSILTCEADAERYLYESAAKNKRVAPAPLTGEALELHNRLEATLRNQIGKTVIGASLMEFRHAESGGKVRVLATLRTPQNFQPEQVRTIQEVLQADVDPRIRLVVRSVVGTDSNAECYLPSLDENLFSEKK